MRVTLTENHKVTKLSTLYITDCKYRDVYYDYNKTRKISKKYYSNTCEKLFQYFEY